METADRAGGRPLAQDGPMDSSPDNVVLEPRDVLILFLGTWGVTCCPGNLGDKEECRERHKERGKEEAIAQKGAKRREGVFEPGSWDSLDSYLSNSRRHPSFVLFSFICFIIKPLYFFF